MRGRAKESRGTDGTVKQVIPYERCGEAARGMRAVSTRRASEGRGGRWSGAPVPKMRMGKDGAGGREGLSTGTPRHTYGFPRPVYLS